MDINDVNLEALYFYKYLCHLHDKNTQKQIYKSVPILRTTLSSYECDDHIDYLEELSEDYMDDGLSVLEKYNASWDYDPEIENGVSGELGVNVLTLRSPLIAIANNSWDQLQNIKSIKWPEFESLYNYTYDILDHAIRNYCGEYVECTKIEEGNQIVGHRIELHSYLSFGAECAFFVSLLRFHKYLQLCSDYTLTISLVA